jgi:SET domain-containing protein
MEKEEKVVHSTEVKKRGSNFVPLVYDNKNLTVKSSTIPAAGLGLFTLIDIPKNARVTEYVGTTISKEDADSRAHLDLLLMQSGEEPLYSTHIKGISRHEKINGIRNPTKLWLKGAGSMANDAIESSKNNVEYEVVTDAKQGKDRIYLKARRNILSGEELFVKYDKTYWVRYNEERTDQPKPLPEDVFFPPIDIIEPECLEYMMPASGAKGNVRHRKKTTEAEEFEDSCVIM